MKEMIYTMKVRNGGIYKYIPCVWDTIDPKTNLKEGDIVKVFHPYGCPKPNTMGCCHVETIDSGDFIGLVSTDSLVKIK
jgi:hypothetical protein